METLGGTIPGDLAYILIYNSYDTPMRYGGLSAPPTLQVRELQPPEVT